MVMTGGRGLGRGKIYTQTKCITEKVSPGQHIGLLNGFDFGNTEFGPGLIIGDGNMSIWYK